MSYRILSLDGGGTWALIEVKALIALYGENTPGHTVLADFDLVAANSGGSIVLGALVENLTLGQLLDFFESEAERRSVFSPTHSLADKALEAVLNLGPKYSAQKKLPALLKVLPKTGNLPLTDAVAGIRRTGSNKDVHLLITAFDYDRNRAKFFRSGATSGPAWGTGVAATLTLADAIHASTNAPVNYFDAPALLPDGRYWDGGITGCNNPILAAVTEAIILRQPPAEIVALSLGTAAVALPWPQPGDKPSPYLTSQSETGLVHDLQKLATSILSDPPDIATFLAHVMTGSGIGLNRPPADSRIVRLNPLISPVKNPANQWSAPGSMTADQFTFLANLDMDAIAQSEVDAISSYAGLWLNGIAPNQPIRMNGDTLEPELGQSRFADAVSAWKALTSEAAAQRVA